MYISLLFYFIFIFYFYIYISTFYEGARRYRFMSFPNLETPTSLPTRIYPNTVLFCFSSVLGSMLYLLIYGLKPERKKKKNRRIPLAGGGAKA